MRTYWTEELALKEAKKYKTRREFHKGSGASISLEKNSLNVLVELIAG